jgi:hypothetical protein
MFRDFLSPTAVRPSLLGLLHGTACGCALGLGVGCIELEPGTDELPDPSQVTQEEQPAAGRDWSCLRESTAPGVLVNSPIGASRLVRSLQITDLVSGTVPPNVFVRACGQPDVDCTTPLSGQIPIDAEGWVDLPLYEGFDGYLEVTAETLVPTMLFYTDPLNIETQVDTTPLGVVTKSLLPGLSAQTGMAQEDSLGLVYLRVFDCNRDPAPGISFSVNQQSAWRWYFVGKLPTSLADSTSDTGLGGFINVTPGVAVVGAELPNSPIPITPPMSVLVRPGWMTGLRFIPKFSTPD